MLERTRVLQHDKGTSTFLQVRGHERAKAVFKSTVAALCWNSHRLSKQSNSGSIRASIGGIETELVVSRGQEILTRAFSGIHTHITLYISQLQIWSELLQIFVNPCTQIYEHTHICVACGGTETLDSSERTATSTPAQRHASHTSRFGSCLFKPAVCLKVRASSQLQQLNIKLAAAAAPRAQLTQSIVLHYSWGQRGPMRWPLTEGWISTVPSFTGAGGRKTPSTTVYHQRR